MYACGMSQSTSPPPPPPAPRAHASSAEFPAETPEARALRIALDSRQRIGAVEKRLGRPPNQDVEGDDGEGIEGRLVGIERVVGRPPDPIQAKPATGMIGGFLLLKTSVEELTAELRAERESRDGFRKFLSRVAWGVGIPIAVTVLVGIGAIIYRYISTLHH